MPNNLYPAVVSVKLSDGYTYKSACTDDEARLVIRRLSEIALADELNRGSAHDAA